MLFYDVSNGDEVLLDGVVMSHEPRVGAIVFDAEGRSYEICELRSKRTGFRDTTLIAHVRSTESTDAERQEAFERHMRRRRELSGSTDVHTPKPGKTSEKKEKPRRASRFLGEGKYR